MRKIAVIVEGASDEVFWSKVLPRAFRGCRFRIITQKSRSKVIQSAHALVAGCRRGGFHAVFILVDLDDDPCVSAVKELFDFEFDQKRAGAQSSFVRICIAKPEFEGWLLADAEAIRMVLPRSNYHGSDFTDEINAEKVLTALIRDDRGPGAGFRKPAFAREMALPFSPQRAAVRSPSFAYFWHHLTAAAQSDS